MRAAREQQGVIHQLDQRAAFEVAVFRVRLLARHDGSDMGQVLLELGQLGDDVGLLVAEARQSLGAAGEAA